MSIEGKYVQYGCGLSCPDHWLNYDSSPRLRFERIPLVSMLVSATGKRLFPKKVIYGDIVKGLPLADGSVDGVYCSHVLEHLDRQSIEIALRNTLRILKPGGTFRLVVPDLYWRTKEFIRSFETGEVGAADKFMRSVYLGEERPVSGFVEHSRLLIGNSAHRWMYDERTMVALLNQVGFVAIRRCSYNDANDIAFEDVEEKSRFCDGENPELSVEASRPH